MNCGAWRQVGGYTNVSALAHLGGLAVGLSAAIYVRMSKAKATRD